jgi:hypothetical protein
MYIYFYYNSPNFRWSIVNVNFWITSRSDIVVSRNVLSTYALIKIVPGPGRPPRSPFHSTIR